MKTSRTHTMYFGKKPVFSCKKTPQGIFPWITKKGVLRTSFTIFWHFIKKNLKYLVMKQIVICRSETFDSCWASKRWQSGSPTSDWSVNEGERWWEGGRDKRAVRQSSRVRKEMRRRDSQSCESYSAANQLTGLCQTNSGVADSGFLIRGKGLWTAISSSWLGPCYFKPTQL